MLNNCLLCQASKGNNGSVASIGVISVVMQSFTQDQKEPKNLVVTRGVIRELVAGGVLVCKATKPVDISLDFKRTKGFNAR